jgi:hypothetical protein
MIPLDAILIPDIQTLPGWTSETGVNIGGVAPADYAMDYPSPVTRTGRLFRALGIAGKYCDVLFKPPQLPILPNTGNIAMTLSVIADPLAAHYLDSLEIDLKVANGGWLYNLSHRLNYNLAGQEEVTSVAGVPTAIGFNPGMLAPSLPHDYQFIYSFDWAAHTSSFVSVTLDGETGLVPAALQGQQAQATNWADGCYPQVELNFNDKGGASSVNGDALTLSFW